MPGDPDGSTLNVHVAMLTVAGPGEKVIVARNGHRVGRFRLEVLRGEAFHTAVPLWSGTSQFEINEPGQLK